MPKVIGNYTASRQVSIARVELFTDANLRQDDWRLVVHFEEALYDGEGALIPGTQRFGASRVERRFGDIKDVKLTAPGAQVTVAQLAALIAAGAYQFQADDEAAQEAAAAEKAAQEQREDGQHEDDDE